MEANLTNATEHVVAAAMAEHLSPAVSLGLVLMQTFLVILMGALSIRLEMLQPGDVRVVGFVTARIALPVLIFHAVATAEVKAVNFTVIGVIIVSKLVVQMLTLGSAVLLAKDGRHCQGKIILRGGLNSLYTTCSADFPIGFPVITALYPPGTPGQDFIAYLTMAAVAQDLIGNVVGLTILEVGKAKREDDEAREAGNLDESAHKPNVVATVATNLMANNLLRMTALGIAFQLIFGWTLVRGPGGLMLPLGLRQAVDMCASPFKFCVLFQLGMSLGSIKVDKSFFSPRAMLMILALNLAKLVILPILMLGMLQLTWHGSSEERNELARFVLIFGCLPPAISIVAFARLYNMNPEVVSASLPVGLCLSAPMIWCTTAIFELTRETADDIQPGMEAGMQVPGLIGCLLLMALFSTGGPRWRRFPQVLFLQLAATLAVRHVVKMVLAHVGCDVPAVVHYLFSFLTKQVDWFGVALLWLVQARHHGMNEAKAARAFFGAIYGIPFLLAWPAVLGPVQDNHKLWLMNCLYVHGNLQRYVDAASSFVGFLLIVFGLVYYKRVFNLGSTKGQGHELVDDSADAARTTKSLFAAESSAEEEADQEAFTESLFIIPALLMVIYSGLLLVIDGFLACLAIHHMKYVKAALTCGGCVAHALHSVALLLLIGFSEPAKETVSKLVSRMGALLGNKGYFRTATSAILGDYKDDDSLSESTSSTSKD